MADQDNQVIEGIDNEDLIKAGEIVGKIAVIAVEDLPLGGKAASFALEQILEIVFDELQPEPEPIWDTINKMISESIWNDKVETQRKFLQRKLIDRKASLNKLKTYKTTTASYLPELISFENDVESDISSFMPDDYGLAFYSLPFFIPFACIHLGLLLTKVKWAEENKDGNLEFYRKDHLDLARKYGLYVRYMIPKAIEWRMNRIEIKSSTYTPLLNTLNKVLESYANVKSGSPTRFKGSYTDSEKSDNDFTISDEINDAKLKDKRDSFKKELEAMMQNTVQKALDVWVKEKVVPKKAISDKLYPDQILWQENLINGNYQLEVTGDTVKMVDITRNSSLREFTTDLTPTSEQNVLWGRQYADKDVFLSLSEKELSIYSGSPYGEVHRLEVIWSSEDNYLKEKATLTETTDVKKYKINQLQLNNDNTLTLNAKREGEDTSVTVLTLPKDSTKYTGKVQLGIEKVVFKCTYSNEGTSLITDRAEMNEIRLQVKLGTDNNWAYIVSWADNDAWEVKPGSQKEFNSDWKTTLNLSDLTQTINFQTNMTEDDYYNDDKVKTDCSMPITTIANLLQIWGGKCRLYYNFMVDNEDFKFMVSCLLSIEAVKD
jgi:hypothetical protein